MRRMVFGVLFAFVVAGASLSRLALVEASTIQGNAVQISGLDDLNATVDGQSRKGVGKIIGLILGVAGLGGIATGYQMAGALGVGSGVAVGFLPGIISSGFDAAPAATTAVTASLFPPGSVEAWWTPLTAALYPGLLAFRFLTDPVFLVALVCAIGLLRLASSSRPQAARAR